MKQDWFYYNMSSGLFTGAIAGGTREWADANAPAGHAAMSEVQDWQSQRVDATTGNLIDYQPPAPANDANQTWTWDTASKRYRATPTLAALKAARIASLQAAIEAQERMQGRPQRELISAFRLAIPAPLVAVNKLAAIDAEISRLRTIRAALSAATTKAQLDAVPQPT